MRILTVDLEEWFHLLDVPSVADRGRWAAMPVRLHQNVDRLLELFDRHQVRATFFCLGWVAEQYPEVVRRVVTLGHDIGSHSYRHELIFRQTRDSFRQDTQRSIGVLEDLIGRKVVSYRAPGFSITADSLWAYDVLAEAGIVYDSSIFPAQRGHGGIPAFEYLEPARLKVHGHEIREFPMSIVTLAGRRFAFSGGGYFRLLPWPLLSRLLRISPYVMTYFHPRDIDPDQPTIPMPALRRFKSYVGLRTCFDKLDRMLVQHRFVDMASAATQVDWNQAPCVEIA